jgi:hypothetical protein
MKIGFRHIFFILVTLASAAIVHAADDLDTLAGRFPELKVMQEGNLPIRVAKENWDQARQRIATDGAWKAWFKSTQAALDAWMIKPRDQADWIGGYPHDLIDPTTKQPLRWSSAMQEPSRSVPGDQKLHQAWVAFVRGNNFEKVQDASRLFRLTGNKQYADWAATQLDFYASNYALWPLQQLYGSRSRMMGQGLDEATATVKLIDAVRLLKDYVSTERRNSWRDKLFLPIVDNLRNAKVGMNNISLWHAAAMAEIGLQFGDESLYQEAINGPMGIRAIMKVGGTSDFIWNEGSLGYQTYVLRALAPLFVQSSLLGRSSDLRREMLIAQNMLLTPLRLRFDDGMLPNPGDATGRIRAIDIGFMLEMYRTLPTRISLIEASQKKNWDTLLDPVEIDLAGSANMPVVRSANLDSIRMAVLKADGWQVFFRYGQLTIQHSHQDALNTEIYFRGIPISTDPGTVLYGSSLHNDYFSKAIAHNVPLVDGSGQIGWDPGVMDSFDAKTASLTASQPRFRPDASATRSISLHEGHLLDRVTLSLKPEVLGEKRLGFLMHSDCSIELTKGSLGPETSVAPPMGKGFSFWEQTTVREAAKDVQVRLHCGENEFIADIKVSAASRIYTAKAPSTPLPKKRSVVYIELVGREASVDMNLQPIGQVAKGL